MFEVAIPIAFFATVALIVKWSLDYKRWKLDRGPGGRTIADGEGLRASELKALIREAVEEANAPLLVRVEAVEDRLDDLAQPRLMPADASRLLDAPEREEERAIPASQRGL